MAVRTLTRQNSIIFVDRDGVINHNRVEHVLRWEDFIFEDGALEAFRLLHQHNYEVVVITNQAAIARGLVTTEQVDSLHQRMMQEIETGGGRVKSVFYCPHKPEMGCHCRKPQPGLLLKAAQVYGARLDKSWLIGDYITDIEAGVAVGCNSVLVLTGRGRAALALLGNIKAQDGKRRLVPIRRNFLEAVKFILDCENLR
ncbi:HAD family hydrolase [Candidatus Chlorohelix sp.]|uniref:D-glycero-alpha-D-manno-heptose-1,7-bisphosphate 7-phosphatase n=1 Tax=Candidatus Chlorohelix sp. TaxID=3139201 RepID=UPI0030563608